MATGLLIRPLSFFFLLFFFCMGFSEGREIIVGGKPDTWEIPSSSSHSQSLNEWAQSTRFRVGDALVWNYDGQKDSVLLVSEEDYASCNISTPIAEYKDGNTKLKLERAGPYYFISGAKGHCEHGQKMIVVVLSPRNHHFSFSPAPSPAQSEGPAPAVAPSSRGSNLQGGLVVAVIGLLGVGAIMG